jgi:hypothetical protein
MPNASRPKYEVNAPDDLAGLLLCRFSDIARTWQCDRKLNKTIAYNVARLLLAYWQPSGDMHESQ